MKRLELSAAARADLADIWTYTGERWGADQAERYGDLLDGAMTSLAAGSSGGAPSAVAGYRKLAVASHLVFYRDEPDVIRVARILHRKMDTARHLPE